MEKVRVLLLSPDQNRPVHNQNGPLTIERFCPPLGLGYLSAVLKQNNYVTKVVDCTGLSNSDLKELVTGFRPNAVGVSCFTDYRGGSLDLARMIKGMEKEVLVVLGGAHATFMCDQMLTTCPDVDFCVLGEGEKTLLDLLNEAFYGDKNYSKVQGIACRSGNEVMKTEPRLMTANLDEYPFPDRTWVNDSLYSVGMTEGEGVRAATMVPARGCPYGCQFCSTSQFWGKRTRYRSVGNIMAEIDLLWDQGVRYIGILADTFTLDQRIVSEMCQQIIQRGYKLAWSCAVRAGTVSAETAGLMKEAGCVLTATGIETLSPRILANIGKKFTIRQAEDTFRNLREAGIRASCLLMVGNPGDNLESIRETITNLKLLKPDAVIPSQTQVYPATPLYELAKGQGFIDDSYWLDEQKASPIYLVENTLEDLLKFQKMLRQALLLQQGDYLRWFVRETGLTMITAPLMKACRSILKS